MVTKFGIDNYLVVMDQKAVIRGAKIQHVMISCWFSNVPLEEKLIRKFNQFSGLAFLLNWCENSSVP